MTNKEAKEKLYMEWQKFLEDNIDYAGISDAYKTAFKALEQEPCEDEYIKVPKKALKYRTAGMVAYNAEWLKNHFDIERAVICGEQEPCDNCKYLDGDGCRLVFEQSEYGEASDECPNVKNEKKESIHIMRDELISRQAVLDQMYEWMNTCEYRKVNATDYFVNRINKLPPVKPQEPKTGHWIKKDGYSDCSECGSHIVTEWDYCPKCGAKMVEPQESEDLVVDEGILALLEKTYDDFCKCEGGEGWLKIDGKEYSTDAGYALEGMRIFMDVFKQRLAERRTT